MHETASTSTMHAVRHADRCQSLLRRHIKPCFPVARKHDTLHDGLAKTCQRRLPLPRHTDSLTSRSVNAHSPTPSLVHSRPSMTPTAHSAPSGSVGPCHPKHKAPLGGGGGGRGGEKEPPRHPKEIPASHLSPQGWWLQIPTEHTT